MDELREIYSGCFPYRDADRWELSDGEQVICIYFKKEIAELRAEARRLATELHRLRYAKEDA